MRDSDHVVMAIDIGGTKMIGTLATTDGLVAGAPRIRRATESGTSRQELLDRLDGMVETILQSERPLGIGVSVCGPFLEPGGRVAPLNLPAWRGLDVAAYLRCRWSLPVAAINDGLAMTLGEQRHGAAAGLSNVLGVVVSTGIGGGLVLDGRLAQGPTGNRGHIGHVVVDAAAALCACGGRGCLEAVASGPSACRWALELGWQTVSCADGVALVRDAVSGNPIARSALLRAGDAIGTVLAGTAALLDLDAIVIGGGFAHRNDLLWGALQHAFRRHAALAHARRPRVVPTTLGVDAALLGAAHAAFELTERGHEP